MYFIGEQNANAAFASHVYFPDRKKCFARFAEKRMINDASIDCLKIEKISGK